MKQLSISAIILVSLSLRSFAGDTTGKPPHFKGAENFRNSFPQATVIECKNKNDLTEVNFTWQGMNLEAFYDLDGNLVATCRDIRVDNLPLNIQFSVRQNYPGYILQRASEFSDGDNSLSYYVMLAGGAKSLLVHVYADGSCNVFKRYH